jgi:hypothetical protein
LKKGEGERDTKSITWALCVKVNGMKLVDDEMT